jgi:hypothetical protein
VRVASNAPAGKYKLGATFVAMERDDPAPIGTRQILHTVDVREPQTAVDVVQVDKRAYLYHQTLALEAYKTLRGLHDYLRFDRVDPPPPRQRVTSEKDRVEVEKFTRHRLRADIAMQRLRAAADLPDRKIAEAAVLAIGLTSKKAVGPAAKAAVIDGLAPAQAIELAKAALDDLRIDDAEGMLVRLRKSGELKKPELGRVIDLLGAVYVVRGRDEDAKTEHGQALCIDPKLELGLAKPALASLVKRVFERERVASNACVNRLAVSTVSAERTPGDQSVQIVVRAVFGPDPRELVQGGDIEIWGGGGGMLQGQKVRAVHDGSGMGVLEARFENAPELENYGGQVLLKVVARDVSGIAIADAGDPDPISVPIGDAPQMGGIDLPWWAYAIAAGVAVAGTATAVAIIQANKDTQHGIGPITAEF